MGKLQQFDISIFENPTLIYYAGQCVTGIVRVTLSETKKFRGLSVTLLGESRVKWEETRTEGSGSNSTTRTDTYSNHERYFKERVILYGSGLSVTLLGESRVKWEETRTEGSGSNSTTRTDTYSNHERYFKERVILYGSGPETSGNNVDLPEGHHQFSFSFVLPQNIPHSYEDRYGSVKYSLKAVIDKAWAFDDEYVVPLQIINTMNLKYIPEAQIPVQSGATKHFCCCCCKSGPLSVMVRLDRKGYAPGQRMSISAEITNLTDRTIHKTKASIQKHIEYHATTKTKRCTSKIAHLERGPINEGESDIWNGELLEIPPTPPSNLEYCTIIDVQYTLNFSACCFGAIDLEIPLDIIIGTQSFNDDFGYAFQ